MGKIPQDVDFGKLFVFTEIQSPPRNRAIAHEAQHIYLLFAASKTLPGGGRTNDGSKWEQMFHKAVLCSRPVITGPSPGNNGRLRGMWISAAAQAHETFCWMVSALFAPPALRLSSGT